MPSGASSGMIAAAIVTIILAAAAVTRAADIPPSDPPGAHDLALLPRMQGARILSYDEADDEQAVLPAGRFQDFDFTQTRTLEGRVTRIAYGFGQMLSTISIMNHTLDVLKGAGFKIMFVCGGQGSNQGGSQAGAQQGCGGFSFGEALTQPMVEAHAGDEGNLIIDFLHPVGNDVRYVLATLDRPQGTMTVAVEVARRAGHLPGLFVEAVEQPPDEGTKALQNAAMIASALRAKGRVALYGIHFVSDQATIGADSRPLLAQVADMLRADPTMKLIIVGHSDNSVPLTQATQLSAARAEAVMQALIRRWKVPATQLAATGVGPVAPVASNADEVGRALNRRIELVSQ